MPQQPTGGGECIEYSGISQNGAPSIGRKRFARQDEKKQAEGFMAGGRLWFDGVKPLGGQVNVGTVCVFLIGYCAAAKRTLDSNPREGGAGSVGVKPLGDQVTVRTACAFLIG